MRVGKLKTIATIAEACKVPITPATTCFNADIAERFSDIRRRHDPSMTWLWNEIKAMERSKGGSIASIGMHFESVIARGPAREELLVDLRTGFRLILSIVVV